MRKTISKLTMILIMGVAFMATSCLGDGESSYAPDNEFAYIGNDVNGNYAMTRIGPLRHIEIDKLKEGDCAFLAFKVNTGSTSGGFYVPEYLTVNTTFPVARQVLPEISQTIDTVLTDVQNVFTSFAIPSNSLIVLDRVLFSYTFWGLENEATPEVEFFYNPELQFDLKGVPLPSTEKVIDVRITRLGGGDAGTEKTVTKHNVVNLSSLRGIFESSMNQDTRLVALRFRLFKSKSTTAGTYSITMTNGGSSAVLAFYYPEED